MIFQTAPAVNLDGMVLTVCLVNVQAMDPSQKHVILKLEYVIVILLLEVVNAKIIMMVTNVTSANQDGICIHIVCLVNVQLLDQAHNYVIFKQDNATALIFIWETNVMDAS